MAKHSVLWASPQPLWGRFGAVEPAAFTALDQRRPALLRFSSDEFMQQTLAILESDPRRIGETLARPETWRNPSGDAPDLVEPVRLPRRARGLARLITGAAAQTAVATTTHEQSTAVNGVTRTVPLKLYQPAHQRHYLVAANLVCGVPGFPDRAVATGGGEQVSFMLRRVLPESDDVNAVVHEYAFVKDSRGPHWERVPRDANAVDHYATTVHGEEMLPLFPLNFRDDVDHPRRMLSGLIPVGRREEYMAVRRYETALPPSPTPGAVVFDPAGDAPTRKSARKEQFKVDVSEPWKALIRASYKAADRIAAADDVRVSLTDQLAKRKASALAANEGAQLQSWLILLDFADYLAHHVPNVWSAVISNEANPSVGLGASLFTWLNSTTTALTGNWQLPAVAGVAYATTMRDALKRIGAAGVREGLEGAERSFVSANVLGANPSWPKFYYLLAGVRENPAGTFGAAGIQSALATPPVTILAPDDLDVEALPQNTAAELDAKLVDKLVQLVMAAIDANATTSPPPIPFAVQVRDAIVSTKGDPGWFVIRCAYVRCDCGPLEPTVLSDPSQRFQLASFFDSDAPARPIRIALPIDTTAAGMRKHQKNTAFVISDVLCGQVNRLKGLGFVDLVLSVLPWPFHKDLDIGNDGIGPCNSTSGNLGMICSLSIPIITICALILLFMIVLVLDLIFKWIPWFIICFPLPGFKAKKATP
jgi:hypothetical protein